MNQLAYPYALLLLLLPFIWRWLIPAVKGLHGDALRVPFIGDLEKISIKSGAIWRMSGDSSGWSRGVWLLYLVWFFLVLAAARPQWVGEPIRLKNESRDIMLVMDISNSMLERDFSLSGKRIDRLTAVKLAAADFLKKRTQDRVGLILFGTRAYLQSPLTFDKQSVNDILWSMEAGMAGNSTSIGDAAGLALKTIKDSQNPENKIIILLTDGENNDGSLSLAQAIQLAQDEKIKVYTIGVGSERNFFASVMGFQLGGGLDESGLKALAAAAKGQYFRAENTAGLQKIYDTIDQLEPSSRDERFIQETRDLYYIPLLAALASAMALAWAAGRVH